MEKAPLRQTKLPLLTILLALLPVAKLLGSHRVATSCLEEEQLALAWEHKLRLWVPAFAVSPWQLQRFPAVARVAVADPAWLWCAGLKHTQLARPLPKAKRA